MKILEGGLPEGKEWRALVLLSPGDELGLTWYFGLDLARSNNGELVTLIVLPDGDPAKLENAQKTTSKARKACDLEDRHYTIIVQSRDFKKATRNLVDDGDIDLVIAKADSSSWHNLDHLSCAVAAVRGERYANPEIEEDFSDKERPSIGRILVPTSGGPNSVHALGFLLPLANEDVEIVAHYIASEYLGENEKALGHSRLRQAVGFLDDGDLIQQKLTTSSSVTAGIVEEAANHYDMVIIGASRESSIDKVLFGNIPAVVVRESKIPVIVVRQPTGRISAWSRELSWALQPILPRLTLNERTSAYVRIRRDARPDIDFFVLNGLSAAIAALGLLANSAAVVIGAMLVAPLMSPIAGIGLAMVLGDVRFLRLTLGATLRGSTLALAMGILAGFIPLSAPLTDQVLLRTQPTLLDLGIAIFSGMAVAYALCRSEANAALPGVAIAAALVPPLASAGVGLANGLWREGFGALLLFVTNAVAISIAAALVFLILGFRPLQAQKQRRAVRTISARVAMVLLIAITVVLAITTYSLARSSAMEARIESLARQYVQEFAGATLSEIDFGSINDPVLQVDLVVRSPEVIPHTSVIHIQENLATELQREIALNMQVIRITELDPFRPPTLTATPLIRSTETLPATVTYTPLATATQQPSLTPSALPSNTSTQAAAQAATATATLTITPSPTPRTAVVAYPYGLNLRAEPDANSTLLGYLAQGSSVILLEGNLTNVQGQWQLVEVDGVIGWVLGEFLQQ